MKIFLKIIFFSFGLFLLLPIIAKAQNESIAFSITPPLIKNNLQPGDSWGSAIKIINNNSVKKDFFVEVYDFKSSENGQGIEFLNQGGVEGNSFLSTWIEFDKGAVEVPAFGSKEIPFIIKVPESAVPGGHYAALLIGNKPNESKEGSYISISSKISTLLLINIAGNIQEDGRILDFSSDKYIYDKPSIKINLQFENTGNVHLLPVGEISILDMYGNEKEVIPINQNTQFGNVLPDSKRSWDFEWKGEEGIFNMGRYKAELKLSYGDLAKMSDVSGFYFWVLDFKIIGIVVGSILFLILLIIFLVKRSIKKALKKAHLYASTLENQPIVAGNINEERKSITKKINLQKDNTVVDLRKK